MIGVYKICRVILLLFLFNTVVAASWGVDRKVKLKDIEVLTFYEGRQTNSRRAYSIPHLKCRGGSAGCSFTPKTVQCQNKGWDGSEVQWECKAQLPVNLNFGSVNVNCEGYDYPGDHYILQGSCGLEYTLENYRAKSEDYYDGYRYQTTGTKSNRMSNLIGLAIIVLVMYGIYRSCLYQNQYANEFSDQYPDTGPRARQTAPPPPGFRSEYYPQENDCAGHARTGNSSGGGGGFWTGAATGGILGYLFGRNNGQGYRGTSRTNSRTWGFGGDNWSDTTSRSRVGRSRSRSRSRSHSATGFGGTTVR